MSGEGRKSPRVLGAKRALIALFACTPFTTKYELEMLKPLILSAQPVVHFSGPARNIIFYFRPVWASENL